jgi:hypothetical protein
LFVIYIGVVVSRFQQRINVMMTNDDRPAVQTAPASLVLQYGILPRNTNSNSHHQREPERFVRFTVSTAGAGGMRHPCNRSRNLVL